MRSKNCNSSRVVFTGDDVDYQTGGVVSARWSVRDLQSSVASCQWAIGQFRRFRCFFSFSLMTFSLLLFVCSSSDVSIVLLLLVL